ncbi:hypothetical protein ACFWPK_06385 [Nocardia sp. NPDC058519]
MSDSPIDRPWRARSALPDQVGRPGRGTTIDDGSHGFGDAVRLVRLRA